MSSTPPLGVVVRRYYASDHRSALDQYEADLPGMVGAGYFPVGQSWGADTAGPGGYAAGGTWATSMGTLAVTFRYDPWAVAERGLDQRPGQGQG